MKEKLAYAVLTILVLLVTFFGLGPVLFADGSTGERVVTLVVVIVIYFILALLFRRVRKKK